MLGEDSGPWGGNGAEGLPLEQGQGREGLHVRDQEHDNDGNTAADQSDKRAEAFRACQKRAGLRYCTVLRP